MGRYTFPPSAVEISINHTSAPVTSLHLNSSLGSVSTEPEKDELPAANWTVLSLIVIIIATAIGNVLVCLAVCWEKRLQNMTNYFLMSLAIADLLVSILVMPLGMLVELYGYFPLTANWCVMWATMDVLMCTASIWHMCTMSMDRYFTLKYPMKYGRNKTKTMVAIKIMFVWVVSLSICVPVLIMGFLNTSSLYNDGACVPTIQDFIIYGSIFAFYVPLSIMVITYILTIKILCDNQKLMRSIVRDHTKKDKMSRKEKNGTQSTTYLSPHMYMPRFLDRPSIDTSLSGATCSINDTSVPTGSQSKLESPKEEKVLTKMSDPLLAATELAPGTIQVRKISPSPTSAEDATSHHSHSMSNIPRSHTSSSNNISSSPNNALPDASDVAATKRTACRSQSHLSEGFSPISSPCVSRPNLLLPRTPSRPNLSPVLSRMASRFSITSKCSVNVSEPEMTPASSLNSMLSRAHYGSEVFSDFSDPDLVEKLSQIEQEMDDVLRESENNSPAGESADDTRDSPEPNSEEKLLDIPSDDSPEKKNGKVLTVPPVMVLSPPITSSDDTLDDTDSDHSDLITIHLKPTGCYLYKLDPKHPGLLPCTTLNGDHCTISQSYIPKQDSTDHSADDLEDPDDVTSCSYSTSMSVSVNRKYNTKKNTNNSRGHSGSHWKSLNFLKRRKSLKQLAKFNGGFQHIISKKTASNEKKASKVLGIIFAVFVVLWTPFFTVNVLSVVCEPCMAAMTPSMMAAIVWLGYLSSLANPIIYTMFNTSFRRAFYKIITCRYRKLANHPATSNPDTLPMTNATRWSDRRNTLTLTLREY